MRKLGIRSIRAAPLVRLKLIELQSLPSHSPVCALILLSEAEHLVRSFHLPVPPLVYETFLKKPDSTVCKLWFVCRHCIMHVTVWLGTLD